MDNLITLASTSPEFAKWIPVLPFLAMVFCGLLGCFRFKSGAMYKLPAYVVIAALGGSFILSAMTASQVMGHDATGHVVHFFEWINIGNFTSNFSYYIDTLTCVMLLVVTGIGTLIAIYASGYMEGDEGYFRFFAYIGLFIFAMTNLVMGDNLLVLFLGWEGVGVASYLLIGFYYRKPSAAAAAKKAFIVNRVGDFGFALGLMLVFMVFGSIQYAEILPAAQHVLSGDTAIVSEAATEVGTMRANGSLMLLAIPFLLMLGAFGKSAQLPLHVWLPDAMEGPTPVSALIHAATMVTAGVYMIARLLPLFQLNPASLMTVAIVGGVTAFFAATIALVQYDIKRIWAYSTLSQLGYMFLGVGCAGLVAINDYTHMYVNGAYGAVFHLFTHAFFKALLFLTAGSVMHALAGQLDLRKMSGLRHKMPVTCWLMFIGCLCLAGVPFTSGWFSKDVILTDAMYHYPVLGVIGVLTAFMTAYYTFRLWFRVFMGPEKYEMGNEHHGYEMDGHGHDDHGHDDHHHHEPHEMPWSMNGPLVVLAVGALLVGVLCGDMFAKDHHGWMNSAVSNSSAAVVKYEVPPRGTGTIVDPHGDLPATLTDANKADAEHAQHRYHLIHTVMSWGVGVVGTGLAIFLAFVFHLKRRELADTYAAKFRAVHTFLYNKWYVDELYHAAIVTPLRKLGYILWVLVDRMILDGAIIDGLFTGVPKWIGKAHQTLQRGALQGYALSMGVGVVIMMVIWFIAYKS